MNVRTLSIIAIALLSVGCSHHQGKWKDGKSYLYPIDDHYYLDTGEDCGQVTKSDYDVSFFAWVHGGSNGGWATVEQAKLAVSNDMRCR